MGRNGFWCCEWDDKVFIKYELETLDAVLN